MWFTPFRFSSRSFLSGAPDSTSTSTPYLESRGSGVVTSLSKVRSYFNQTLISLFLFFDTGIDTV